MHFSVCVVVSEGCPLARPGGDPPVQTHRQFQSQIRSLVARCIKERGIDLVKGADVGRGADDLDARLRQKLAATARFVAWLGSPEDHPCYPSLQE